MMKYRIEPVPELDGYTVEWAEPGNFYLSRRNILFQSGTLQPPFQKIATIEAPFWKSAAARWRPAQRLLRFLVTNVIPLDNGELFVTFDKTVGVVRNGLFRKLEGLKRPCRVLRGACAVDERGAVFFGEYLANQERGEMRIYKFPANGEKLETVYTFEPGAIKHIHGLYADPFSKAIFCLTGDAGPECRVLRSFDGFQTVETIGEGDETWRAVSLLFSREHLFYGTDAEFRANQIYQVSRETLKREALGEVNGTVFYSNRIGNDLFFTTTAENAPSQKENVAAIWQVDETLECHEMIKFKKDFWHPTLFMFGTIHFPAAKNLENELYFHLVGVENDNRTFIIRPEGAAQ